MNTERKPGHGPVIFVPYIHAFGGSERLILGLSRFMNEVGLPHTVACFKDTINLASRTSWPVRVLQLKPARNAASEAAALRRFLKGREDGPGFRPLLFDVKSAFYTALAGHSRHFLHLTDPPGLLGSDISKHAYSARGKIDAIGIGRRVSPLLGVRAEAVHRITRRGVRDASRVIVMTERIAKEVRDLYGVDPIIVRPGVQASQVSSPVESAGPEEIKVLSVSRIEAQKNLEWILQGMAGDKFDWKVEFAGTGPDEAHLRELAVRAGITDRVVFHGFVSEEQLAGLYSKSDVVAVPAAQGYGLPALEALARRTPVVLNRASGVSEILRGSRWVALSDDDARDFERALRLMVGRVRGDDLTHESPPDVPTEVAWAESICRSSGWL